MTRPARRDLRLLPVAASTWATALVAVHVPGAAAAVAIALWILAAALLAARFAGAAVRGHTARILASGAVAIAAVSAASSGAATAHVAFAEPSRAAVADELDRAASDLVVDVATKVEPSAGGVRFSGSVRVAGTTAPVTVTWSTDAVPEGLDLGARVAVSGGSSPTEAGDASAALVFAQELEVIAPPPHIYAASSTLRRGFVEDTVAGLPEPGAGLLPGLSVGETSGVSDELDQAMKASSLSHLTAVSGSNCALVVGIAFAICAACGLGRRTRVVVSLAVLAGFVVLVTPEASVIRAAAMASIAMLALLLGRRGAGTAVLALAVAVLVASDPWLASSYGFVLSAGATGALLLLAEPLARGLDRWMPRALSLGIAVPLAAQVVCGPIIVLFAPEVALYGVVANMIAGPAAPAATVLGLVACLAHPFPPLALGAAALAWLPSAWVARTAEVFASLPSARLAWQEGVGGFVALAILGACAVVVIARLPPGRTARILRRASAGILAVALGAGAGTVALGGVAAPLTAPRDWSIALCDVGQGDAVVLRSAGRVAIVDTGPDEEAFARCLARLGVGRVDLAFLTHFDADHVTGVPALAGRGATILHGPAESGRDLESARAVASEVREAFAGTHGTLGEAAWRVLWPARDSRAFGPGNDTSLVLEIAGPGVPRTLLLGDLSEDAQQLLSSSGRVAGAFDVVKVSHHGSRDQSSELYLRLGARLALIGVGENNYGHPHPDLLATLAQAGSVVARSDRDGLVLVDFEDGLTVWREHGSAGPPERDEGAPAGTPSAARERITSRRGSRSSARARSPSRSGRRRRSAGRARPRARASRARRGRSSRAPPAARAPCR